MSRLDAVVVGSGPNGLAAAVVLARSGLSVQVLEAQPTIGGGARTLDLGLADGIVHDLCSAVHPMAIASPFLRAFDLPARGVDLRVPEVSYAQPLDDGRAGIAWHDLERTCAGLGADGPAWRSLLGRLSTHPDALVDAALGERDHLPRDLVTTAALGLAVLEQGTPAWGLRLRTQEGRALLAGVAMHAIAPLPGLAPAGAGTLLAALAHAGGWPVPVGGTQSITDALVDDLRAHGGEVLTERRVRSSADLPAARAVLLDTTPRAAATILADRLSARRVSMLRRFRYGDAAAKVDFVLSGPVPWAHPDVSRAGTVHVGGSRDDLARAEAQVHAGRHAPQPAVLLSDPTVLDPGREHAGLRPLWTYAHVPAGSTRDVTEDITAQIERFAPGFRDLVVASRCIPAAQMSDHNANYIGGDIAAGAVTLPQVLARPGLPPDPYTLGEGAYLCSASTAPGPGVHGLCGAYAARRALRDVFGITAVPSLAP